MGMFDKLFGSTPDYPELSQSDPAAGYLDTMRQPVEKFVSEISDPIEVVPASDTAYFFIGKPPKKFGIAWIGDQGEIVNFKSLVEKKGLSMISLEKLSDKLKEVYTQHQQEPRYSKTILDKKVVVTPSETLREDVQKVVKETVG
jgi:hypothetical protein